MTAPTVIGTPSTLHVSTSSGSSSQTISSVSPETGSDRKMYVAVSHESGTSSAPPNYSVTWDGTSLTSILEIKNGNAPTTAENGIEIFELLETDFPGSAADIVVNLGGTTHNNNLGVIAVQVQDADQVQAADEASNNADANSYSLSVTDSESLVLQWLSSGGTGTYAIASPATAVTTAESAGDFRFGMGKIDDQSSGSVTLNASGTDTTRRTHAAIAIPPASPSGGGGGSQSPVVVVI